MNTKDQKIWIGDWDLSGDESFVEESHKEFSTELPILDSLGDNRSLGLQSSRRDFLKYLGFGVGAATIAASCEIPLKRAIPYVIKPDDIVPGVANYYASSFVNGGDYCSVLVKTREGRPIKIEGNDMSGVTRGGTSARAQAVVLSLYDTNRFKGPQQKTENGKYSDISWADLDKQITGTLTPSSRVRILTGTQMSPATRKVLGEFKAKFPNAQVVAYDAVSSAAMLKANEQCFGMKSIPDYHFDKAKTIVGIQADFLGTWISPIEYAKDYIVNRRIQDVKNPKMSRHYQIESYFSLAGSKADNRIPIRPSETGAAVIHLYNAVAAAVGVPALQAPQLSDQAKEAVTRAGRELAANRGQSLVVCGTNNIGEQVIVNKINDLLGNYGHTIDFGAVNNMRQGDESALTRLGSELENGQVDALFVWGVNPVFELPNGDAMASGIAKVPLSVSFALLDDETTSTCKYVAPAHHILESWGDAEPKKGHYSLIQPTISPLFDTRQPEESLLRWCGTANLNVTAEQPFYEYLKKFWQTDMFALSNASDPTTFWERSLHNGVFEVPAEPVQVSFSGDVNAAAHAVTQPVDGMEITFYESVNLGAGQYANNPWLMEMPDPLTRCSWGNYLGIPLTWDGVRHFIGDHDLDDGHLTNLTIGNTTMKIPVIKQFGQVQNTLAVALGYGRANAGRCGSHVGVNIHPFLSYDKDGLLQYHASGVSISQSQGREHHFSCIQYHHTMGVKGMDKATHEEINADEAATIYATYFGLVKQGYQGSLTDRTVIRKAHLEDIDEFVEHLEKEREEYQNLNAQSLYPDYSERFARGHHWGMHIDLNACIGCGACTVACMAENNVPIVGKKEISRHHEMTWIRIDRYYHGDVDNPSVVYQPLMCQQCDNAPCENVCPVNATDQSSEGINQMAYNRCVGTRYCMNNCPYKVRRFNWLDYNGADLWPANERGIDYDVDIPWSADNLTRMVLNPDVTVRSRGVMEKCSFCVQRIQAGKLTAKLEGRELRDADVRSACQTACPTGAITFGDQNNPDGELMQKFNSKLNYAVLEEINTRPSVRYTSLIQNTDKEI